MGITKIVDIHPGDECDVDFSPGWMSVTLQILTGRTHQIRYHLSHHGLPIVGDYLYGKEDALPMQLTAYKLVYQDIDGSMQVVEL